MMVSMVFAPGTAHDLVGAVVHAAGGSPLSPLLLTVLLLVGGGHLLVARAQRRGRD